MLCGKEAIGMVDEAEVHPDGPWPEAKTVKVIYRGETYHDVNLEYIRNTPAMISVSMVSFPRGVVILNELPPPPIDDPITLPVKIATEDNQVEVQNNGGWPAGTVVLFMK